MGGKLSFHPRNPQTLLTSAWRAVTGNIIRSNKVLQKYIVRHLQRLAGLLGSGFMLVVFDEAENLNSSVLYWLRQRQSLFEELALWTMFLSTKNCIPKPTPAQRDDPSRRQATKELSYLNPVIGLPLDIDSYRRFRDPVDREKEVKKPLEQFASCDHLTIFGRPLWRIHWDSRYARLVTFVTRKLLSGPKANTLDADHVFALLASRLCLDLVLNTDAAMLASNTVNSHLRLVIKIDQTDSTMKNLTPSEPIVAEVAASILMARRRPSVTKIPRNWVACLSTFCDQLLSPGLVEKGIKGKLYARLVLLLAKDYVTNAGIDSAPLPKGFGARSGRFLS